MGRYINELADGTRLPAKGKAEFLFKNVNGSILMGEPKEFEENLVCVVSNGAFDAAGYAYSEDEMNEFKRPDGRHKWWMIVPGAKELAK